MQVLAVLTEKDTWSVVASIATTTSVMFLVIGPRLAIVRRWVGTGLQEMLGVTRLQQQNTDLQKLMAQEIETRGMQHRANQREFRDMKSRITETTALAAEISERVETHMQDTALHNGKH